ncbi:MAG: helicase HerA-like C-terminal domain-containing protein [Alphaproteobacteria bacterium]
MTKDLADAIFIGANDGGENPQYLTLKRANRHGLVAGATGTGKTVTLQNLAEAFSRAGTPVFMADVKGDLSGLSQPGEPKDFLAKRAGMIGLEDYEFDAPPVVFWDLFGRQGHPIRTTISEMGPLLLARILGLNDTQEGVLTIAFQIADDEGMLLLDLKDLRALLIDIADRRKEIGAIYGNVATASVGAIQRRLLELERQEGDKFFGEPALDLMDLMRTDRHGRGIVNVLAADELMMSPKLYATFLLWLLAELFEELPEIGDPDQPELVFFFDEAHLLFDDAPKALIDKIEQVVRLVRSKGVGVFFVTQSPADVPDDVLGQLGNRVQHALRAFTPRDQRAVKTAADTFRQNPDFSAADAITEMGVGEALTSFLDEKARPGVVQRTLIRPPTSRLGPATKAEREKVMAASPVAGRYDEAVDRESAYEILQGRTEKAAAAAEAAEKEEAETRRKALEVKAREKAEKAERAAKRGRGRSRRSDSVVEAVAKSAARSVARSLGRELVRGLLGMLRR